MRPSRHDDSGLTLVEILVALTILGVGLLALAGASATVSRLIGDGRWSTAAMGFAERRVDLLRAAGRESARCGSLTGGTAPLPGGLTEQWSVSPGGRGLAVEVVVSGRFRADTLSTILQCQ
jgi:prepilin-type N-terminal cleavage/methylation domain-containing protein